MSLATDKGGCGARSKSVGTGRSEAADDGVGTSGDTEGEGAEAADDEPDVNEGVVEMDEASVGAGDGAKNGELDAEVNGEADISSGGESNPDAAKSANVVGGEGSAIEIGVTGTEAATIDGDVSGR